jgi:hypothetical protein
MTQREDPLKDAVPYQSGSGNHAGPRRQFGKPAVGPMLIGCTAASKPPVLHRTSRQWFTVAGNPASARCSNRARNRIELFFNKDHALQTRPDGLRKARRQPPAHAQAGCSTPLTMQVGKAACFKLACLRRS